jgi:hypothetical protein
VAVVEVAKPVMKRGQFALTGTTVAGERSLAFLKEISGGKARTVKMGDTINGLGRRRSEARPRQAGVGRRNRRAGIAGRRESENHTAAPPTAQAQPGAQQGAQQVAAGQQPAHPPGTGVPGQEVVNESSLAERRRACPRRGGGRCRTERSEHPPQSPPAVQPPQQSGAAGTAAQPDTGWAAMYQRYQQRRN